MKRNLLACLIAAAVVVGCQPEAPRHASNPAPTPAVTTTTPEPTPDPAPINVADPDRVNQLKDLQVKEVGTPRGPINVWIMDDTSKRMEGMMFLRESEVKDNEGMLFAFANERDVANSFWMKDTLIPLDIIFLGKDGKVINVGKGVPQSEDQVKPTAAYWYVLELKEGQAAHFDIRPGVRLTLPEGVEAQPDVNL